MKGKNRLSSIFTEFVKNNEFAHRVDESDQKAQLEIPITNERVILANYVFDSSGGSYEFEVELGKVSVNDIETITSKILRSNPTEGITERITEGGKYLVLGNRNKLENLSDAEIQRVFIEDVSLLTKRFNERFAGDSTTDAPPPEGSKKKKKGDE